MVYAIVKAGGRQEKVSVGDVVVVDKLAGEIGDEVTLAPLLLVDGDKVTSDAAGLAEVSVAPKSSATRRVLRSTSSSSRTRPVTVSVRATAPS